MDRFCSQDEAAFNRGRIILDIEFAAGSSGAVPTTLGAYTRCQGIDSMSLAATGLYTVHLSDSYVGIAKGTFSVEQATYDAAHGCRGEVDTTDVGDDTDPLVTFQCIKNSDGTAVAVTSGDIVRITLELIRLSQD